MKILLTGASGFIGGALRTALRGDGHALRLAGRRAIEDLQAGEEWVSLDLARPDGAGAAWRTALSGVDVLVNTVGILRERGGQTFAALHVEGPRCLFQAAVDAGVRRIVHISALGADGGARSSYHRSKKAADDFLLALPVQVAVAQPSLVFGPGGASARWFATLAALPLLPLPAGGRQPLQPIHLDDLVACLVALIASSAGPSRRIALVGPEPLTLAAYLEALRRAMGLPPAWTVSIPRAWVSLGAGIAGHLPGSALDRETWQMLERGNVAPVDDTRALLGRLPRRPAAFVPRAFARSVRRAAQLDAFVPLLRLSIAAVWIVTGIVSLGPYPVAASYALLARTGLEGALASTALYGAALLDLGLGLATLLLKRRRWLWLAQIVLILGYTLIISVQLPEFWLHPYGPVLKNLPMLAALWLLYSVDREAAGS
jgi:uncharacterized protein YbjT (DUF2867 family)